MSESPQGPGGVAAVHPELLQPVGDARLREAHAHTPVLAALRLRATAFSGAQGMRGCSYFMGKGQLWYGGCCWKQWVHAAVQLLTQTQECPQGRTLAFRWRWLQSFVHSRSLLLV